MTLWNRIKSAFQRPDPRNMALWYPSMLEGQHPLSPEQALQLSVVWACVDAIARSIASCPWHVYVMQGTNRQYLPNDSLDYKLNVRPNDEMTAMAFREALLYSALTYGNGYALIIPDESKRVRDLYPLEPDRMTVDRDPETGLIRYTYQNRLGGEVVLGQELVYHLRGPSINGLLGENMVVKMARSLALTRAAETFATAYFANNTVIGAVLEYPKTLDKAAYERLKAEWNDRRRGEDKAFGALILEGGMKFNAVTNDPASSQMVESRKLQVEEICRWYGVPPHKVMHLERSTYNNIEHQSIEFVRDALTPWCRRMEQEADWKLFPMKGPGAKKQTKIDTTWLSQGDFMSRAQGYQIMRRIGVYSANDIRAREGENSIGPEGDVRIIETNMQPLEMAEDRAEAEIESMKQKPEPKMLPSQDAPEADMAEEDDTEDEQLATNVATLVLQAFFENALNRHQRRVNDRLKVLKMKLKNGELGAKALEATEKSRLTFQGDLSGSIKAVLERYPGDVVANAMRVALQSVEAGVAAEKAAAHLVATVTGGVQ